MELQEILYQGLLNADFGDLGDRSTYVGASDVGGCRYGWFTTIADDAGILIDDFQRYAIQ